MEIAVKKAFIVFLGFNLAMAIHAQARLAQHNDPNAVPGFEQAELIFNAVSSGNDIVVWVNGAIAAHVRAGTMEKIIVQNGRNRIEAAETPIKNSQWNIINKRNLNVNSNSNRITVEANIRYGALASLIIQSTVSLGGSFQPDTQPALAPSSRTQPQGNALAPTGDGTVAFSLENAVQRAADRFSKSLPSGAVLAILSVATNDPDVAEFVIGEFAYLLVQTRKFRVVDRRNLEHVRAEHSFQISGEVSDASAVSIGQALGADIVITGSVSGSGATRRLRVQALKVETIEILDMASERY